MQLEKVTIERFRSIEKAKIKGCGGFNVLIGKNNSGKSNILSAMRSFFDLVQGGNAVTLDPPVGEEIDFFERATQQPIDITLIFEMTLAERDALMRDIVNEAPQMKNAIDGLDPSLRLSVTTSVIAPPENYGFVSQIILGGTTLPSSSQRHPAHTIFRLEREAAGELHERLSQATQSREMEQALTRLLQDMEHYGPRLWRDFQEDPRRPVNLEMLFEIYPLRRNIGSDLAREVLESIGEVESQEEFEREIEALIGKKQKEATEIEKRPLRHSISTFSGDEPSVPHYVHNLLARISDMNVLYLKERRKPIGKEEAGQLLSLKMTRGGPEQLQSIQETVSALLGVKIDAFQSESVSRRRELSAEMDVDDFLVEVNGSGIREALRIILDFEFEHPDILLVEEPEMHLHPALETSIMRYLKRISKDCQVFISTHSTNFLDTGEMENVYLVSKPDSTSIQLLDYEEAETRIPSELGIRLSSLFMFDRLVFVEGPSDEDVLREWASTMKVNLSRPNVGFIHMGGVRNFTHFATEATLSFLTRRNVQMWFLLDRDEKDEEDIARLREIGGENAKVKVLGRRQLENYLLPPRAVIDFIDLKRKLVGNHHGEKLPTESEIEAAFTECAEELHPITINKRIAKVACRPVYPCSDQLFDGAEEPPFVERVADEIDQVIQQLEERRENLQEILREKTRQVSDRWGSEKLDIIPGDRLLDEVCRKYGVRFKKVQDNARLARLMSEEEIPQEIKDLLSEISA